MAQPWRKRILKSKVLHRLLSHIAAVAMRLLLLSCRVTREFAPSVDDFNRGTKRGLYIFWHGRMIMMPFLKPPGEFVVLISHHNDGALITTTMQRFGIGAVRGSKSKGSSEAVRGLVDASARGANMAITPDGPRGPFQVAAPGALYVGMRTGCSIVPIAFSATRHWRLRSWDKFMIPKPFSHVAFVASEPFTVPADMDEATLVERRADLTERLNAVTRRADEICGVTA